MANPIFQDSKILHLNLNQAKTLHPIWKGQNLDIPLDAINPQGLAELLGLDFEDDWIEWLMITHPIILVEKQRKKSSKSDNGIEKVQHAPEYYRVMGHSTFNYLANYISFKYGSDDIETNQYPMTVIPQKKIVTIKNDHFE